MRRVLWILPALAVFLGQATPAAADLIAIHQGANDPLSEGFGFWPFNGGISASPISNDQGMATWSITSTSGPSFQAAYEAPLSSSQVTDLSTQGFTMSFIARAPSGPTYQAPTDQPSAAGILGLGSVRFDLELGLDAAGNTVAILGNSVSLNGDGTFNVPGSSVTLSGNGYHLYQLSYNATTQSADLFIDGVDRITGYSGHTDNPFTGFYFGALDLGTGNFNLAELATGQLSTVPEPSSALMAATTTMALLVQAGWRRRRSARS